MWLKSHEHFHIRLTISEWSAICLARPILSQIWNTRRRQTGQTDRWSRAIRQRDKQMNRQTNLLSVVVGLEDIADGSAVTSPPRWLQNDTKQPLVVLMGRTLNHTGERELEEKERRINTTLLKTCLRLKLNLTGETHRLTLSRVTCVWGSISLKDRIYHYDQVPA